MNQRNALLIPMLVGCIACATSTSPSSDSQPWIDPVEQDILDEPCVWPTLDEQIRLDGTHYVDTDCTGPGVSGNYYPIPSGGWLVYSTPSICCTDTEYTQVLRIDSSGRTLSGTRFSDNAFEDPGPRRLVAVLSWGFVTSRMTPWDEISPLAGDTRPIELRAYDFEGGFVWTAKAYVLNQAVGILYLDNPSDDEFRALLYYPRAVVTPGEDAGFDIKLALFGNDGTITSTWDVPGDGRTPSTVITDTEGFTLILESDVVAGDIRTVAIDGIRVTWDGSSTGVVRFASTQFPTSAYTLIRYQPTGKDLMVCVNALEGSETVKSASLMAFLSSTGQVRWVHVGPWSDDSVILSGFFQEVGNGMVASLNGFYEDGILKLRFRQISADGLSDTVYNPSISKPFSYNEDWLVDDWFTVDGQYILHGRGVIAVYDRWDFAVGRSAQSYLGDASFTRLLRNGDDWLVVRTFEESYEECGPGFTYRADYLLPLESICNLHD